MFLGLQWREAGASHRTWIIKTERMPLPFCRVSAQSVGKVETGDTVLKGAGNENKLVLQMTEVRCRDWASKGRGYIGRGLRMIWNGFRDGGRIFGGSTKGLMSWFDWEIGIEGSVGFCSITWSVFVLSCKRHTICQTLSDYRLIWLFLNALMFACLFTWTKLLRLWGGVLVWVNTCMNTNMYKSKCEWKSMHACACEIAKRQP